ncbi:uncharacterized protein LOC125314710 [Rhodamnia argentea]|uniref:Uncharacterized protein LOC125314710 n=1 Tax=Rhodamnia argentea TaxID=178133 RepID=A0ABM3HAG6_9MYRT|nr:uncharacterized protein LOC125314710 [Rhodamnia argentea]
MIVVKNSRPSKNNGVPDRSGQNWQNWPEGVIRNQFNFATLIGNDTPGLWPRQQKRKLVGTGSQVKVATADGANSSGNRLGPGGGSGAPPPPRNPVGLKHEDSACVKRGKLGHWDCDGSPVGGGTQSNVPQKACPCGLGDCLVVTSNTKKNRGRRFYKCPLREENGGCGFFEWCDNASGAAHMPNLSSDSRSSSQFPDLLCPCGAESCLILTVRTGSNAGQQFYRCPIKQGPICGFFKLCNDPTARDGLPASAGKVHNNFNYTGHQKPWHNKWTVLFQMWPRTLGSDHFRFK